MRTLLLPLALGAALTACAASPPVRSTTTPTPRAATPPPPPAPAESSRPAPIEVPAAALALIERLRELPYPSLEGHPIVRVTTGEQIMRGDEMETEVRIGVLIAEEEGSFTVVHEVRPREYRTDQHWRSREISFERAAWPEVLEHEITSARAAVESEQREETFRSMNNRAGPRLRAFFVARAALDNGHEQLGRQLLELATRMDGPSMPLDNPDDGAAGLAGDLAFHLTALAVEAYGHQDLDRPQLAEEFARIQEHFPGSEAAVFAGALAPIVSRMILEDATGPDGDEWERHVFALRDSGWGGSRRALSEGGLAAAPALVAVLEDDRLTRSVGIVRQLPRIETYGSIARDLLEQLSGERLATVAAGQAWLREVNRVGHAELLATQVRRLDHRSPNALQRLLRLDARRGVREATRAIGTAPRHVRSSLIRALADSDAEVPARFYRRQLSEGSLDSRVHAALALAAMDDDSWVSPMIEELRTRMAAPEDGDAQAAAARRAAANPMETYSVRRVLSLLIEHGGARGVDAMSELFPSLPLEQRLAMISSVSRVETTDEEASRRIQGFLERALSDDAPAFARFAFGGLSRCIGTVADIAATTLAARTGATYECGESPERRARRRAELINAQRSRRSEPPLPLPELSRPPAPSASELDAAELALNTATREEAIGSALARFTALGPSAAPRLYDLVRALDDGDPRRAPGLEAAAALASTVSAVVIEDAEQALPARAAFEALQGVSLERATLPTVLARAVSASTAGNLTLTLYRDAAGRGVSIRVRSEPPAGGYGGLYRLSYASRAGDARPDRESEHLALAQALGMRGYRRLANASGAIIEGPPTRDGALILRFTWTR